MGKVIIALGGGGGLDTDECTAGRPQVLSGYTAGVHGEDDPAPGTMPEKGAWTGSVAMNGSVTIPEGHHNGKGKVNGPAVTQRGAWTGRIGVNGKAVIPEGYHNGSGYVDQSITNRGTWNGSVAMNGSVTVPEGYHNGSGKVSGPSVTQRGAVSASLNCGGSYTVPEGYHNGSGRITANSLASQTSATATAAQILSGKTAWVNGSRLTGTMVDYSYLAKGQTSF